MGGGGEGGEGEGEGDEKDFREVSRWVIVQIRQSHRSPAQELMKARGTLPKRRVDEGKGNLAETSC